MAAKLVNWSYRIEFGGGYDRWRLGGMVYNHPDREDGTSILVSTPVYFNEVDRLVRTKSGSEYILEHCAAIEQEQFKFIREDVERGGALLL